MRNIFLNNPAILLGGFSAFTLSTIASALKPITLTALIADVGLSEAMAGLIVGSPFIGMALASQLVNPLLARFSANRLTIFFVLAAVLTQLLSAFVFQSGDALLVLQFVFGLAVGVFLGTCSIAIGCQKEPDLLFGIVDASCVLAMSFLIAFCAYSLQKFGLTGTYLFAALMTFLLTPFVFLINGKLPRQLDEGKDQDLPPLENKFLGILALVVGVLLIGSLGLGFAFIMSLGTDLGLEIAYIGEMLGLATLVSALGPAAGGLAANYFGRNLPMIIAMTIGALCWALMIYTTEPGLFIFMMFPGMFFMNFCIPILLSQSASLDQYGRWAAMASPLLIAGFAVSPIVGGLVVGLFGMKSLAISTLIGIGVCLLIQLYLDQAISLKSNGPSSDNPMSVNRP